MDTVSILRKVEGISTSEYAALRLNTADAGAIEVLSWYHPFASSLNAVTAWSVSVKALNSYAEAFTDIDTLHTHTSLLVSLVVAGNDAARNVLDCVHDAPNLQKDSLPKVIAQTISTLRQSYESLCSKLSILLKAWTLLWVNKAAKQLRVAPTASVLAKKDPSCASLYDLLCSISMASDPVWSNVFLLGIGGGGSSSPHATAEQLPTVVEVIEPAAAFCSLAIIDLCYELMAVTKDNGAAARGVSLVASTSSSSSSSSSSSLSSSPSSSSSLGPLYTYWIDAVKRLYLGLKEHSPASDAAYPSTIKTGFDVNRAFSLLFSPLLLGSKKIGRQHFKSQRRQWQHGSAQSSGTPPTLQRQKQEQHSSMARSSSRLHRDDNSSNSSSIDSHLEAGRERVFLGGRGLLCALKTFYVSTLPPSFFLLGGEDSLHSSNTPTLESQYAALEEARATCALVLLPDAANADSAAAAEGGLNSRAFLAVSAAEKAARHLLCFACSVTESTYPSLPGKAFRGSAGEHVPGETIPCGWHPQQLSAALEAAWSENALEKIAVSLPPATTVISPLDNDTETLLTACSCTIILLETLRRCLILYRSRMRRDCAYADEAMASAAQAAAAAEQQHKGLASPPPPSSSTAPRMSAAEERTPALSPCACGGGRLHSKFLRSDLCVVGRAASMLFRGHQDTLRLASFGGKVCRTCLVYVGIMEMKMAQGGGRSNESSASNTPSSDGSSAATAPIGTGSSAAPAATFTGSAATTTAASAVSSALQAVRNAAKELSDESQTLAAMATDAALLGSSLCINVSVAVFADSVDALLLDSSVARSRKSSAIGSTVEGVADATLRPLTLAALKERVATSSESIHRYAFNACSRVDHASSEGQSLQSHQALLESIEVSRQNLRENATDHRYEDCQALLISSIGLLQHPLANLASLVAAETDDGSNSDALVRGHSSKISSRATLTGDADAIISSASELVSAVTCAISMLFNECIGPCFLSLDRNEEALPADAAAVDSSSSSSTSPPRPSPPSLSPSRLRRACMDACVRSLLVSVLQAAESLTAKSVFTRLSQALQLETNSAASKHRKNNSTTTTASEGRYASEEDSFPHPGCVALGSLLEQFAAASLMDDAVSTDYSGPLPAPSFHARIASALAFLLQRPLSATVHATREARPMGVAPFGGVLSRASLQQLIEMAYPHSPARDKAVRLLLPTY